MNNISRLQPSTLRHLRFLEELRLSGNQISRIPGEAFSGLYSLKILRLDANLISVVPEKSFEGLLSLRHLWLDDNALTEIPVQALNHLPALQAMTLALNQIWHIPDYAFQNLSSLVVLHLHNNRIQSLGANGFDGLHSLETLHFYDNPIQFVGQSAFQYLPKLHTLSLNGATDIREFPDLKGTTSLEVLTLTRAGIRLLPRGMCQQLPSLRVLDLSWNYIQFIHPEAFVTLRSLTKLDLTDNRLVTLPLDGLGGLTHLKLQGNPALSEPFTKESFPKMSSQAGRSADFQQRDDLDADDLQLDLEESKLHPTIQCTPSPGPFKPCDHLFESWIIRLGVWVIVLVSVLCNGLVILAVFASPSYLSPLKFIIGSIAGANMLTGIYCSMLALVDALTYGQFAKYGARWETGTGCRVTGFLSVFASEAAIFLLTLAAMQCSISVSCVRGYGKSPALGKVKAAAFCCLLLSSVAAVLPLFSIGEYGASPLCLPYPIPDGKPATLGFTVALVMTNMLCFLTITGTYIRLYCNLLKGEFSAVWDCAMVKHVAWLIFTNCLLYCPVAFLTFSSTLNLLLITPEVIKSVLLVVLPLPACLNPLLYLLFNPHFRDDLRLLRQKGQDKGRYPQSCGADDMEKSSYDSTQALVSFSDIDHIFETPDSLGVHPMLDSYSFPSMTLVPCQQRVGTRGKERGFSEHCPCLNDNEVLITSESRDPAGSSLRIAFFPSPPTPPYTSHL
ncbi:leucine-rich repeat-containing g-protein coupled receptor 6 [Limosa lapponica baueri]|uniref:Leucine-rich repeat-containing g-protein coupled receptor 6 n=1 Tax=Limosa lapponica baueri TaxID=1758121 RepID=A0A2I0U555_LIMLA|nr:leucine-rich repeat-containing g-protein coupled receptor 6 [Limosa lapponica baueri]